MYSLNSRVSFGVEEYRCINDVIGLRGKKKSAFVHVSYLAECVVCERTDVERTLILRLLARLRSALQLVVYYSALTTFSRHPHK